MTDYTNDLPPMAGKRGKEIVAAWKVEGIKYCSGRHSPVLMKDRHSGSFALDWFDHNGVLVMPDGERIPFIEPYCNLDPDRIDELNKFCKERDLRFSVSLWSPWFPGSTMMIKFHRKETK